MADHGAGDDFSYMCKGHHECRHENGEALPDLTLPIPLFLLQRHASYSAGQRVGKSHERADTDSEREVPWLARAPEVAVSIYRPAIALKVFHRQGSMQADLGWLVKELRTLPELTIVYVPSQSLANE